MKSRCLDSPEDSKGKGVWPRMCSSEDVGLLRRRDPSS